MITKKSNYAVWTLLIHELDDAEEHLETLMREMTDDPKYDEANFRVDLGHIYSRLNRAWNAQNRLGAVATFSFKVTSTLNSAANLAIACGGCSSFSLA